MKKLLVLGLLSLGFSPVFGQNFYATFSAGYAAPIGSQAITYEESNFYPDQGDDVYSYKSVNGSYGAGTTINASIGYMFNPVLGLDLNFNYLIGNEYTGADKYGYTSSEYIAEQKIRASGFFASPTLLVNVGGEKFSPYAKLGMIVGKVILKEDGNDRWISGGQVTYEEKMEAETTGKLSVGVRGGIGVRYAINLNLSLFGEVMYTGMNYLKEERNVTRYDSNGDDVLDELYEYEKKTIYKKEITGYSENPDLPREELQTPAPLSSVGFNFGIQFSFKGI